MFGAAILVAGTLGAGLTAVGVLPAEAAIACGLSEVGQNVFLAVGEGNYATATNWSAGHTPVADDHDVCIPGGTVAVYGQTEIPTHELVGSHDGVVVNIRIEGTLRIQNGVTVSTSGIYGGHNLFNGGVIQVLGGSTLNFAPDQNGAPAFQNIGNQVGGGQIQIQGGSTLNLQRPLLNNSTIDVTGGGTLNLGVPGDAVAGYTGTGTVVGGPLYVSSGVVDPTNGGPLAIHFNTNGGIRGTIGANQSVELQCKTFSGGVSFYGQVINNGTMRMIAPANPSDGCGVDLGFRQGTGSLVNNGQFIVGDPSVYKGFGYFGTNSYNPGSIVNGPSGTVILNDVFSDGGATTNNGTWNVSPTGAYLNSGATFTNAGTFVNNGGCQVRQLESNGVVDLGQNCTVLQKSVLGAGSTLRLHANSTKITKLTGGDRNSTLGGTLNVVTDPVSPPAIGTVSDIIETGTDGTTFAAVTGDGGYSYSAIYAAGKRPQVRLDSFTPGQGGGGGSSAVTALSPGRLLDTRSGSSTIDGQGAGAGLQGAGQTIEVQVAGRAGVPTDAAAAILNVTVTEAQGAGFVTVWPCGSDRPNASSLNFVSGSTVANGVISKIGSGGKVCLYVSNATQILADVSGYFAAASPYAPLVPARVLDTRGNGDTADGQGKGGGPVALGSTTEVQITGRAGVPADAAAAVLNVTVTEAQGAGYVTVFPCGTTPPNASNLNFVTGSTVPNNVIGKIGAGGKVCLFTSQPTHLIVDVAGYFRATASFQPLAPGRVLDTRATGQTVDGLNQGAGLQPLNGVIELPIAGRAGVPASATAAVLNVTVTEAQGNGFVTVWPCGTERPNASSVNFTTGATVPNGVIAKVGDGGKVCLYVSNATHLIADVAGYFTG